MSTNFMQKIKSLLFQSPGQEFNKVASYYRLCPEAYRFSIGLFHASRLKVCVWASGVHTGIPASVV
jgi:hypothetical protein